MFSFIERRKKNKKHAANLGRCFTAIAIGLVVSLIVTGPYQIAMLRVCRPGEVFLLLRCMFPVVFSL